MQAREIPLDVTSSVTQFWAAHDEALFAQPVLVALTGLSAAYFERARWEGGGPRFLKFGRLVRYRKADVVDWINQRQPVASTSETRPGRLVERPA
jgi:predicted DNA-binding transcriptional regulator AlpA